MPAHAPWRRISKWQRVAKLAAISRGRLAVQFQDRLLLVLKTLGITAPRAGLAPAARRAVEIHDRSFKTLAKTCRFEHGSTVLVDVTTTVEDQAVVAAHQVGVHNRRLVVRCSGRDHLPARAHHASSIRRSRKVEDELGTAVAAPPHRPLWRPNVLADLERDGAEIERDDGVGEWRARRVEMHVRHPAREGARFVEDVVGGQFFFGAQKHDAATVHEGSGVEEIATNANCQAQGKHSAQCCGFVRKALQMLTLCRDEASPLDQVLSGVAADDLLGKGGDGHVLLGHLMSQLDTAIHVGPHRADRRVDTRNTNLD